MTHSQAALDLAGSLIDNLDEEAIKQLGGGSFSDIDEIFNSILKHAEDVISYDGLGNLAVQPSSFQYLEKLSSNLDISLKKEDIIYFTSTVLPEVDLAPHLIEWGHMAMWYQYLTVIAARDTGKSFFFDYIYHLWKLFRYEKSTPTYRAPLKYRLSKEGCIFTESYSLGKKFLGDIKDTIESNDLLREYLYPANTKKWNEAEILCQNGAKLYVKSYGSSARGLHPTYIVIDDFLTDAQIYSADQREKYKNYFQSVIMYMLVKKGQAICVGTPFHDEDLYADMKKKKKFTVFEYPAVFPDGRMLYPGRYNFDDLLRDKESATNLIFSREKLCKPITSDATIFPYASVSKAFAGMDKYTLVANRESFPIQFKKIVMGCDFAISATVGADYSVFLTFGIDEFNNMWLLNVYREKGKSYKEQLASIKRLYMDFRHDVIFMETNQMQMIFAEGAEDEGIPIYKHNTNENKNNLTSGLPGLSLMFDNFKFKFPRGDQYSRNMTDIICSELANIAFTEKGLEGVGSHDDTCMSLWLSSLAAKYNDISFAFLGNKM